MKVNLMNNKVSYYENSFDILKLVGSFIVLLSHSFRHFDIVKPIWSLFFTDGSVGVMIFFAITGFAIIPSWERAQNKTHPFLAFFCNRILRIYPGIMLSFLVLTIINCVILKADVLSIPYLTYALKYCVFIRGDGYGNHGLSNGVLWTIKTDIVYYLLVPFIFRYLRNLNKITWMLVIMFFWSFNVFDNQILHITQNIPLLCNTIDEGFPLFFVYEFLIGSFLYFNKDSIIGFFLNR